jgi:hypothetical protein
MKSDDTFLMVAAVGVLLLFLAKNQSAANAASNATGINTQGLTNEAVQNLIDSTVGIAA